MREAVGRRCRCAPLSAVNWSANLYTPVSACPADGQMPSLILPWVDARLMGLFLAHTAAQFPNEYCVLFLDGTGPMNWPFQPTESVQLIAGQQCFNVMTGHGAEQIMR